MINFQKFRATKRIKNGQNYFVKQYTTLFFPLKIKHVWNSEICWLNTSSQGQDQMKNRSTLNFVIGCGFFVIHLFTTEKSKINKFVKLKIHTNKKFVKLKKFFRINLHCTYKYLKMSLCWLGGIPSFSSTRSLMRSTCKCKQSSQLFVYCLKKFFFLRIN